MSHLSFIGDLGDKNKEGIVKKRSFNIGFCQAISFNLFWDSRLIFIILEKIFLKKNFSSLLKLTDGSLSRTLGSGFWTREQERLTQ